MSNEIENPKKNNVQGKLIAGIAIGCGCAIFAFIAFTIIVIALTISTIMTAAKSEFKTYVDPFFDKYNQKDMNYICREMGATNSQYNVNKCLNEMNHVYDVFGKEISYTLNGFTISTEVEEYKKIKKIDFYSKFEKYQNAKVHMELSNYNGKYKISKIHIESK